MSLQKNVVYVSLMDAATTLGLSVRTIRNLCAKYDWFGGKMGDAWVLTMEEVDKMRGFPRQPRGNPNLGRKRDDTFVETA